MARFKTTIQNYLDKAKFSAVKNSDLWAKLKMYANDNSSAFSRIDIDEAQMKIKFTSPKLVNDLCSQLEKPLRLSKNVIRELKLNVKFNKETKQLQITNENTSDDMNSVSYEIICDKTEEFSNSMFFHESSLVDYTDDTDYEKMKDCHDCLALLSFKETDLNAQSKTCIAYLCYDKDSKLLKAEEYPSLNDGNDLKLDEFISYFNSGESPASGVIEQDEKMYSNFKLTVTDFKMTSEEDFINFMSFAPTPIVNSFITDAKKQMKPIWE